MSVQSVTPETVPPNRRAEYWQALEKLMEGSDYRNTTDNGRERLRRALAVEMFHTARMVAPPSTPASARTAKYVDEDVRARELDLDSLRYQAPPERTYRSVEKDPFCTDRSFFGSGRYRPTGYAPRDRNQAPNFVPRREPRRGPYTGAAQPDYPRVNRKFGNNTRERVMPFRRYTHMHETGYDDDVVGSQSLPSFLNPAAALGQSGSAAVLAASGLSRTLGPGHRGSQNFLLDG